MKILKNQTNKLILVLFILALTTYIAHSTKRLTQSDDFAQKIQAAQTMKSAMDIIYDYKVEQGLNLDPRLDINLTGIIGNELTDITTTYGDLASKRTTTNPNFAALIVTLFQEIHLKRGDTVAVNFSGSFPGVNLAVLSALEAMDLNAIIISTVGASTYGANDPDLTYLDMEQVLWQQGVFKNRSHYYSMGGIEDLGKEFNDLTKASITKRLNTYSLQLLSIENLETNIYTRYQIYHQVDAVKAFINVGGNLVSFGKGYTIAYLPGGIVSELPKNTDPIGLGQLFIADGIPIVHFLNIKDLVTRYGLPIDPVPLPSIGEGGVYFRYQYSHWIIIIGIALSLYLLKGIRNEAHIKSISVFKKQ